MSAPGPRPRGAEEGSATVEFIGWTVGVVVPVLYLIVALAQIQAASFAVASAADAAARVLAVDAGPGALAHARAAVGLALGDQGIGADPAQCLSVECAEPDCGGGAVLRVKAGVSPPLLEGLVGEAVVVHSERVVTLAGARGPER